MRAPGCVCVCVGLCVFAPISFSQSVCGRKGLRFHIRLKGKALKGKAYVISSL